MTQKLLDLKDKLEYKTMNMTVMMWSQDHGMTGDHNLLAQGKIFARSFIHHRFHSYSELVEEVSYQKRGHVVDQNLTPALAHPKDFLAATSMSAHQVQRTLESNSVQSSTMSYLKESIMIGFLI